MDSLPTSTTCKLFANDLKIYSVLNIIDDANSILSAFDTIKQWASIWQLQIYESKSNWLFIGRTVSSFNNAYFASDNNAMSSVSCIKDLDVFMDCDLSFSKHIDDITRRAYQRTYMIYKGFVSRDKIMLSKAYTTYVRPLLEYRTPISSPTYVTDIVNWKSSEILYQKNFFYQ